MHMPRVCAEFVARKGNVHAFTVNMSFSQLCRANLLCHVHLRNGARVGLDGEEKTQRQASFLIHGRVSTMIFERVHGQNPNR